MSTPSVSINDLAAELLAHIFAFLSPDERVRFERVCRHWLQVAKTLGWTEFRVLTMDKRELAERGRRLAIRKKAAFYVSGLLLIFGKQLNICPPVSRREFYEKLAKYRVLVDRCALHLRELRFAVPCKFTVEQWIKMRNLRHLLFDHGMEPDTLIAVADNLTRLKSLRFYNIVGYDLVLSHYLTSAKKGVISLVPK